MKLQFSVRGALILTALACVWAAVIFSTSDPFALPLIGLLTSVIAVGLILSALRRVTQPPQRAFYTGALVGLILWLGVTAQRHYVVNQSFGLYRGIESIDSLRQQRISNLYRGFMLLLPLACGVGGLLIALAHWLFKTLQRAADRELASHRLHTEEPSSIRHE